MTSVRLSKHHALGNDFLVLLDPEDRRPIGAGAARALCDRRRGVGADGLIRVSPGTGGADVTMTLRNVDGSLAETSGNGLRCLAQAVTGSGGPDVAAASLVVATGGGQRRVTILSRPDPVTMVATVEMGPAKVVRAEVGGGRRVCEVDLGNPHLVVLAQDEDGPDTLAALGRAYPDRNVQLVAGGPEPGALTVRVWERGVGETLACGSGACAAVAALGDWGALSTTGAEVTVHLPGGDLIVTEGPETMTLTGPTVHVADVEVPAAGSARILE